MEQIKIVVNGCEKLASGVNKETTVEDIKFAMLYSSVSKFKPELLNEYGLFEQWQSNERLLDSNVKIYKIIKLWKQIPGDQLSQVKFVIKRKCSAKQQKQAEAKQVQKEFKYCSLSPSVQKTWNENLIEKNQKSSYVRKQLEKLNRNLVDSDLMSVNSIPSSAWSSGNESEPDEGELETRTVRKRYASIKRFNRSRNSSVKRVPAETTEEEQRSKLNKINQLRSELKQIQNEMVSAKQQKQKESLSELKSRLNQIDNMILIKTSLIASLEQELKRLNETPAATKLCSSSSSSSIGSNDTGISSTCSDHEEEVHTQRFETLV
jgi:hypothetical protein